jgi:hypothetical protein
VAQRLATEDKVLRGVSAFAVILMILVAPALLAQMTSAGNPAEEPSAAFLGTQASTLLKGPRTSVATLLGNKAAFAALESQGVSFLPSMTYSSACWPGAVAVGDLNGDGYPDLAVSVSYQECSQSGPGKVLVLLGNGDGTFRAPISYGSGGMQALHVAIADLNGDGKLDVAVANSCAAPCSASGFGQIGILLGNGDGTLQPAVSYSSGGSDAWAVAVADVNGDGHPDLIVDNYAQEYHSPGSVGVLLGNGDGTFRPAVSYTAGTQLDTSLAVGDLNRDGYLDVVVIGGMDVGEVIVLLGNGDGTFQPQTIYDWGGYSPESVAIADVNADEIPDIVVASYCEDLQKACTNGNVNVLLGNGDGTFHAPVSYTLRGFDARSVAIGDVNGDSRPDLVVTSIYPNIPNGLAPGEVNVLLGNGDGTFQTAVDFLSGGAVPRSIAVADLNGDKKPDLVEVNPCEEMRCIGQGTQGIQGTVGVLLNNAGSPQFSTTTAVASSLNPSSFGKVVTFRAAVTSAAGTPTGTVRFFSEIAKVGSASLVNGSASVSVSTLVAGTHQIVAVYQGSVKFNFSGSMPLTQTVKSGRAVTFTALASSPNPSTYRDPVTFTATVRSPGGVPPDGEIITFYQERSVLGSAYLTGGTASLTRSILPPGVFHISAVYFGDASFIASVSPTLLQVVDTETQSATATALSLSLNPSTYGQEITWTARVTTLGSASPTGKVNFRGGDYVIGQGALNANGMATLTRSNLNANSYPITAVYLGDANNGPSVSVTLNQIIKQTTSKATLGSSSNPSVKGQAVTFTATITSPTVIATGPVTFTAGKAVLGTAQLMGGGKAAFSTSILPAGSTTITVTYYGNSNIAKSSASLTQTVQ